MINLHKNTIFLGVAILVAGFLFVYFGSFRISNVVNPPEPSADLTSSPQATKSSFTTPTPLKLPIATKAPLPTGDGRTTFIDEAVPWSLLLGPTSCRLQGEIKFLNHNTYDNQDAQLIYSGVDHPARNIFWTVTPLDDISVGPNLFSKIPLPNGENLLSISLPENPKYNKYELTAKIQYGRLVDDFGRFVVVGGNAKVFEKQCDGKTVIVLP